MLKPLLILTLISLSTLHAVPQKSLCLEDKRVMHNSYYMAQKKEQKSEYKEALHLYKESLTSANSALQSCTENKDYNYKIMYDFIVEDEKRINNLADFEDGL